MKAIIFSLAQLIWVLPISLVAQPGVPSDKIPREEISYWQHDNPATEAYQGVSTDEAYTFLKGKKSKTVVVAIIDSGVDVEHEDLKDNIWVNEDEIPGNGLDDDKNGFVDDVHGWNFLGNKAGKNIVIERLEMTRIYAQGKSRFEGKSASDFTGADLEAFQLYQKVAESMEAEKATFEGYYGQLNQIRQSMDIVDQILGRALGKEKFTMEEVQALESSDERTMSAKEYYLMLASQGIDKPTIESEFETVSNRLEYQLNTDYDPRKEILGDDLASLDYGKYGNNDVIGGKENCEHGTHVAGIIGAVRNNSLGIDGIAADVKLMVLRTVPDGDEYDKDVANAIRYAVDNGAQVLNMSFGKDYSPQRSFVNEAMIYAQEKGVLLIHGSGNDSKNNDLTDNYPNNKDLKINNWVDVGANAAQAGPEMVAGFSNYGRETVEIFAPGVDIYSTLPDNTYGKRSGTSMASPVVAGVAALVWSYYPELTAAQLREILMDSGTVVKKGKVYQPSEDGEQKKTKFKKLSVTGSIVNAYQAVELAEKRVQ